MVMLLACEDSREATSDGEDCSEPSRDCRLLIEVIATRLSACGEDYDRVYRSLASALPCGSIERVRDCGTFHAECLPELRQWPCFDLEQGPAPPLPEACETQLIFGSPPVESPELSEAGLPRDGDAGF